MQTKKVLDHKNTFYIYKKIREVLAKNIFFKNFFFDFWKNEKVEQKVKLKKKMEIYWRRIYHFLPKLPAFWICQISDFEVDFGGLIVA